jgi:hypothetical protein
MHIPSYIPICIRIHRIYVYSRRHPRGVQEAFQRPQTVDRHCRCYVLCFHQGQAECAKLLNTSIDILICVYIYIYIYIYLWRIDGLPKTFGARTAMEVRRWQEGDGDYLHIYVVYIYIYIYMHMTSVHIDIM